MPITPRKYKDKDSAMAPLQVGFNITPHASNELPYITRVVMVTDDGTTITGYLEGDDTNSHTTAPLKAGLMYSFAFKRVTAVSAGTAKGYA